MPISHGNLGQIFERDKSILGVPKEHGYVIGFTEFMEGLKERKAPMELGMPGSVLGNLVRVQEAGL